MALFASHVSESSASKCLGLKCGNLAAQILFQTLLSGMMDLGKATEIHEEL